MPFIHETLEKDQCADLPERLQEEKDKIVTKILRKMQDIIDSDGSIVIKESALAQSLKTEWTIANTFFADFCEQCLEVTDSEDDYVSLDELYTAYKRFCVFKKDISSIKEKYEILTKPHLINALGRNMRLMSLMQCSMCGEDALEMRSTNTL